MTTGVVDWLQLRQNLLLSTQRIELYNPSYWDKEATVVNENMVQWAELTEKQLKMLPLSSEDRVLDVGAGTGRMTLPMAKRAKQVTALESSQKMLAILRENAQKQHIHNIGYINESLEQLNVNNSYDWVVASFSLFMYNIESALAKMNGLASRGVYLFLSASPWMDIELQKAVNEGLNVWSDFIFIYNILYDNGIPANVEIWDYQLKQNFADLESAVSKLSQTYRIPASNTDKLRGYLKTKIVEENGKLFYNRERKAATIWWTTNQ
ncbi:MAG: class I SAM-dependent methyltransferase [Candidatus Bathyarchaeia archaeon]|jgi:SAM-dependent methyltransferase